jgi:hypothetical protein
VVSDIDAAAKMAGQWWAERLDPQHADKREAFAAAVEKAIRDHYEPGYPVHLECDYDPQGPLLEAVRAAGIECGGFLSSARGILPQKHDLTIWPDRLEPKEGYGNWTDDIVVESGK